MPAISHKKNLVILGMHRSGTSMVARLLEQSGFFVGRPEELLASQEDNPLGFWERRDVVHLNDRMLADQGAQWYGVAPEFSSFPYREDIQTVFSTIAEGGSPWLIKDPRMVLTWRQWQGVLADAQILYVYRSALSVAGSLQGRNGFPLNYGLALWEYYNRLIMIALADSEYAAVSFDDFAANPDAEITRLLGDATVPEAQVFEASLDHSRGMDAVPLTVEQQSLTAQLQSVVVGTLSPTAIVPPGAGLVAQIEDYARFYTSAHTEGVLKVQAELDHIRADREKLLLNHQQLEQSFSKLEQAHEKDNVELEFLRAEYRRLGELEGNLAHSNEQLKLAEDKSNYLFDRLDSEYRRLLAYSDSLPGWFNRLGAQSYKIVRLRPRINTAYDDILTNARAHIGLYGAPPLTGQASKFALSISVLRYVLAHPVSSLRSFSWHRLSRASSVFFRSERRDLELWVRQRFPDAGGQANLAVLPDLGEDYDELSLNFVAMENPAVSIVIPVYNEYRMTVFCLQSILQQTAASARYSYEIIIADDASTDLTASLQARITGVRVCRGETNRGFVRNCCAGAELARGGHILFLNNDTAVTAGWLDALVSVLETDPKVGIVGPKLLFGSGQLQEAGGIVWDDASAWNYGRMDDAGLPAYNYMRTVDYVSGACLMIRRELWLALDGFDQRFVPAYYEDTDLCFAARDAGFEVVYQPASVVYHFEGVSHGTDSNSGIKRHQLENQAKFLEKWRSELTLNHFENADSVFCARDRSRHKSTVLVIDHQVPSFDKDAGSRSTWLYLKLLVEMGYNIKFIGANFFPHQPYTEALQQQGIEVLVGEQMAKHLDRWLLEHAPYIDTIYINRPHVAEQFLLRLKKMMPAPRLIFFGHDLHYLRTQRELAISGEKSLQRQAEQWRQREFALFSEMDHIYYPSQVEVDEILAVDPSLPVRAIPLYIIDEKVAAPFNAEHRTGMLFVAGFNHPPNKDGLDWFVNEVMPLLATRPPRFKLHVVGSNMPSEVLALASEQVEIHGHLSDESLLSLYGRVKMAIVPLRYGAGVKGKVIEALQQCVPLVTTSVGAEGFPEAEMVMTIADDPQAFAEALVCIEQADDNVMSRLANIPAYLDEHFGKARARAIVRQDFGDPRRSPA